MTTSKSNKASNSHSHYHAVCVWQNANLNFYHRHCQSAQTLARIPKDMPNEITRMYTQKTQTQAFEPMPIPMYLHPQNVQNVLFRNKTTVWHTEQSNEHTLKMSTRQQHHAILSLALRAKPGVCAVCCVESEWQQANDKKQMGKMWCGYIMTVQDWMKNSTNER